MRRLLIYALLAVTICSCGIFKKVSEEQTVLRDSIYVERVELKDTTIYVPVPVEVYHTIAADSSHLETSVAFSDAWVDTTGMLHHNLQNKRTNLSATIPIPTKTIYTNATTQQEKIVVKTQYIKKKQTWKNWIIAVSAILLIFAYRKQIIKIIKRWLTN